MAGSGTKTRKPTSKRTGGTRRGLSRNDTAAKPGTGQEPARLAPAARLNDPASGTNGQPANASAAAPAEPKRLACMCARQLKGQVALAIVTELSNLDLGTGPELVSPLNPLGYVVNQLRGIRDQLHRQLPVISRLTIWQFATQAAAQQEGITCDEYRALLALLNAGCTLAMTWRDALLSLHHGLAAAAMEEIPGTGMADQARTTTELFRRVDPIVTRLVGLSEQVPEEAGPFGGMFGLTILSFAVARSGANSGHSVDGRNGG